VQVSSCDILRREITIRGSFPEIDSFPAAITALSCGRARTTGLITHRFGLDDNGLALETLRDDDSRHKVMIRL
jgi:D-arabinitol dehydrogenase (NADP+)